VLGASRAGLRPIWFCPPGQDTHVEPDTERVVPENVVVVEKLVDIVELVKRWNQSDA
jgi:hypothetical protein